MFGTVTLASRHQGEGLIHPAPVTARFLPLVRGVGLPGITYGSSRKHVLRGRFKGLPKVILTVRDFGFTCRLGNVTPRQDATPLYYERNQARHTIFSP